MPLPLQDHVHQPFDDVMPYEEFSVRVEVADIPYLMDILHAIPYSKLRWGVGGGSAGEAGGGVAGMSQIDRLAGCQSLCRVSP